MIAYRTTDRRARSPTPRPPTGPIERALGHPPLRAPSWSTRPTAASTRVIVVGTGLAGGSAGATLAEQGYHVVQFCFQDSPRRAHSIAAQGGINAAKNYRNDGDSVHRLFYDTVKGGDFRVPRVQRLPAGPDLRRDHRPVRRAGRARSPASTAACSTPARSAACRSPRTFYARGQTGQQLLLGAYQALSRQIAAGQRRDAPAHRDARPDRRRRPGPRHRRPRPGHRRDPAPTSPTPSCWPPAATATSSTCRPTPRAPTPPRSGGRTSAARTSPTPASPRSTRPASRAPATTSRS